MTRRALLLAVLVYVALDLSLPSMPGAFVFDAGDSVEGAHAGGRQTAKIVVLPAPLAHLPVLATLRQDIRPRRTPLSDVARLERAAAPCRPRAVCAPSPPSEDPH